jgi:outer membrane protein OmpA-like peptidoglycan-associated protein
MSIRKNTMLAMFLAPTLVAGAAYAVEPGFYLGASGGQTNVDKDANDFGFNGGGNFEIDDDDTGWKAYLGYNFMPWLGVEAGYVDFGNASKTFAGNNIDLEVNGWEGFLVGLLPLGPVDLFAKVGAIDLRSELDTGNFGTNDESDTQLAYGVGAAYNIGHWGLRVEAEGYDDNEVDDFYFVSAGVTYHFFHDKPAPVAAAAPAPAPAACPDGDNDGVCTDKDECPSTPAGAKVDAVGCDCDFTLSLEFAFDSAKLSANDMAKLDEVAGPLKKEGAIGGTISGYTDSVGTDAYNMGLSKRRADAVANYLESKGVQLDGRFTVNGYGESDPVASNDTAEGRAQNRRVVVSRTDCK